MRRHQSAQMLLRDTNLPIISGDSRQLDFVAWGQMVSHPICGDATIFSPLHRDGTLHALASDI